MTNKENTGVLFANRSYTEGSKQPRLRGTINVEGKQFEIAAWFRQAASGTKYYSLKVEEVKEPKKEAPKKEEVPFDDAVPF